MPKPTLERPYRQLLIIGIRFYRILIRPFISNECQFAVTCSQFTLDLAASCEPFEQVMQRCLQRYCECSRPFDRVLVGNRLRFISCEGREVDPREVSPKLRAAANH